MNDIPWLVAAGQYDKNTGHAALAAVYAYLDDVDVSKPFDIEDHAHMETGFDTHKPVPAFDLSTAAYRSGASMAAVFGERRLMAWSGLDEAVDAAVGQYPGNAGTVMIQADTPDEGTRRKLLYLKDGLSKHACKLARGYGKG